MASLLAMVHRARKVLGSEVVAKNRYETSTEDDDIDEKMNSSWKKFAQQNCYDDSSVMASEDGRSPHVELSLDDIPSVSNCPAVLDTPAENGHNSDEDNLEQEDQSVNMDIMGDCSEVSDEVSPVISADIEWICANAPASKVGLLEGFSLGSDDLCSSIDFALRRADSAVDIYTTAMTAATIALNENPAVYDVDNDTASLDSEEMSVNPEDEAYEILLNDECNALRVRLAAKMMHEHKEQ